MEFEYDPAKSAKNARERGLPFDLAAELEWRKAVISVDDRFMYGEERLIAFAPLRGRLYAVCYVQRGEARRIISFRKANKREERLYAKATADE
jgi:uncharacterized DUF497 family protein